MQVPPARRTPRATACMTPSMPPHTTTQPRWARSSPSSVPMAATSALHWLAPMTLT